MAARFWLVTPLLLLIPAALAASGESSSSLISRNYPPESLARGEQGAVAFTVELDRDARIESCLVTRSSGYPSLDMATCDLIVRFAKFAPAESNGARVATRRTGKVEWKLPSAYQARAASAPPRVAVTAAALEAQRLICKRATAPGSFVKVKTHCLTREEWDQALDNARQEGQEMIQPRQADHGCAIRC